MEPPDPVLIGWIITGDALIALAYFTIPAELFYFYWKLRTQDIPYKFTLILFVLFIVFCGCTHTLKAVFFHHPLWYYQAVLVFITAVISLATAVYLLWVLPRFLNAPIQMRNLEEAETALRRDIVGLSLLRGMTQQLRTALDKRTLVASFCNILLRDVGATSAYVFIDNKLIYSLPTWYAEIQTIHVPNSLQYVLNTSGVTQVESTMINQILGLGIDNSRGVWFACSFTEMLGREVGGNGYVFVMFREISSVTHTNILYDLVDQFQASLRLVNLVQVDQERIRQLAEQNDNLVRARKEAQVASEESKEWLYIVSHEMRTPLFAVVTLTNLLLELPILRTSSPFVGDPNVLQMYRNQLREDLGLVRKSSKTLMGIINNLLDFSRIESGTIELQRDTFALRDVLEDATEQVVLQYHDRSGPSVNLYMNNAYPSLVTGDSIRLSQIIINLVDNAMKFTQDDGNVRIEVTTEDLPNDQINLYVAVKDTGKGVKPENVSKLFHEFTQVEDTPLTRKAEGTGLGLVITKKLCQVMQGDVTFAPNLPSTGSQFIFNVRLGTLDVPRENAIRRAWNQTLNVHLVALTDNDIEALQMMFADMTDVNVFTHDDDMSLLNLTLDNTVDGIVVDVLRLHEKNEKNQLEQALNTNASNILGIYTPYVRKQLWFKNLPPFRCLIRPMRYYGIISWLNSMAILHQKADPARLVNDIRLSNERLLEDLVNANILVVEDNKINQIVMKKVLTHLGLHNVDMADDGQKAIEKLDALDYKYDIIFMDIMMPNMDGYECTQRIRAKTDNLNAPWIIAITAAAMFNDRVKAIESGMNDFLTKPATIDAVRQSLHHYVHVREKR